MKEPEINDEIVEKVKKTVEEIRTKDINLKDYNELMQSDENGQSLDIFIPKPSHDDTMLNHLLITDTRKRYNGRINPKTGKIESVQLTREVPDDPYDSSWWTPERLRNELIYRKAVGLPITYSGDFDGDRLAIPLTLAEKKLADQFDSETITRWAESLDPIDRETWKILETSCILNPNRIKGEDKNGK
jgi:hypothetical protein